MIKATCAPWSSARPHAVQRHNPPDVDVLGQPASLTLEARPVHDDRARIVGARGIPRARDQVVLPADLAGGLGRSAADAVSVQDEHGRLSAREQRLGIRARRRGLRGQPLCLELPLDGHPGDRRGVGRLAHLVGEELAEEPDAHDQEDQELDGGHRGGDERGGAPGWGSGKVCSILHGPV